MGSARRYKSIDALQTALGQGAFSYAADSKKAAGRALGTFVELISFYLLKTWGLERCMAIERGLPEFANPGIAHNVEFTLHGAERVARVGPFASPPWTARRIASDMGRGIAGTLDRVSGNAVLDSDGVLKNACTIGERRGDFLNAYAGADGTIDVFALRRRPFAMFECKRVGVEKGQKKGPQTIEKAKQGAYVARTVSPLQRIRLRDGRMAGFVETADGSFLCEEYYSLLSKIVAGNVPGFPADLTLTVGIVSNHGNWFTSDNRNKELEVLAQSYDWLLFLTDDGLARFITDVVFSKSNPLPESRKAFFASYGRGRKGNRFTKSRIDAGADAELTRYFSRNASEIESWFNMISPDGKGLSDLRAQLSSLAEAAGVAS